MLWLTWQIWILLLLALLGGVFVGWMARARSDAAETPAAPPAKPAEKSTARSAAATKPSGDTPKAAAGSTPPPAKPAAEKKPAQAAKSPANKTASETAATGEDLEVARHARGESTRSQAAPDPVAVGAIAPAAPETSGTGVKREAKDESGAEGAETDLTRIKGLGPKAEAALKAGGITTFAQIAAWSETDVDVWDDRINGRGRIERDSWVSQARDLAG